MSISVYAPLVRLRNAVAAVLRTAPRFRGKARAGALLARAFAPTFSTAPIVTFPMRHGGTMRVDLRVAMENNAYWTGEYDHDVISRLEMFLRPDDTVLDVGANIGFYTAALGVRLRSLGGGTLLAFEPVRPNYERLTQVVALNHLETVVQTFPVALGDEEGEIELFVGYTDGPGTGNAVIVREGVGEFVERTWDTGIRRYDKARLTRLDALVTKHPVSSCRLLKIDIEGAELLFLQGAKNFLSTHRPIIYGEFNPIWMQQFGHSFLDVASLTSRWGYRFFRYIPRRGFSLLDTPTVGVENILLLPAGVDMPRL